MIDFAFSVIRKSRITENNKINKNTNSNGKNYRKGVNKGTMRKFTGAIKINLANSQY
jgi:hypothetical protein